MVFIPTQINITPWLINMTKQISLTALLYIATSIATLFLFTSVQADTTSTQVETAVEAVTSSSSDGAEATSTDSTESEKKEVETTETTSKNSEEPKKADKKKAAEGDEEPDCE
jgi:hypothetical protein